MKPTNPYILGIEPIFSKIDVEPIEPKPSEEVEEIYEEEDTKYQWKEGCRCPHCHIRIVHKEYLDIHGRRKGKNRAIAQWKDNKGNWVYDWQTRIYCNCGQEEIIIPKEQNVKGNKATTET